MKSMEDAAFSGTDRCRILLHTLISGKSVRDNNVKSKCIFRYIVIKYREEHYIKE